MQFLLIYTTLQQFPNDWKKRCSAATLFLLIWIYLITLTSNAVVCGGIVCDNNGEVINCRNTGKITAKSDIALCYAGGIVARNILNDTYPKLEKNKAECDIDVYSKSNVIYVGGVAGFNASEVDGCGFVGNIKAVTDMVSNTIVACVGGVVGYNRECKLENSYAKVVYLNRQLTDKIELFGGIAGTVYAINNIWGMQRYGLTAVKNNHYIIDASFDAPAYGFIVNDMYNPEIIVSYTALTSNEEIFISHEKLEDILPEVLVND